MSSLLRKVKANPFARAIEAGGADPNSARWDLTDMPPFFLASLGIDKEYYEKNAVNDPALPDWLGVASWDEIHFRLSWKTICTLMNYKHQPNLDNGTRRRLKQLAIGSCWLRYYIVQPTILAQAFWEDGKVPQRVLENNIDKVPVKVRLGLITKLCYFCLDRTGKYFEHLS
jgi:hypothetical protein